MSRSVDVSPTLAERLWARVDRSGDCWEWTGSRDARGYGRLYYGLLDDATQVPTTVHRAAWELAYGPVPDDRHVLHSCDNPPCVRLSHLHLGTRSDNMREAFERRRHAWTAPDYAHRKGQDIPWARLTPDDVRAIRQRAVGRKRGLLMQLAREYGVGRTTIGHIVRGDSWKSVV